MKKSVITVLSILSSILYLCVVFGGNYLPQVSIGTRALYCLGYILLVSISGVAAAYAIKSLIKFISGVHYAKTKDILFGLLGIITLPVIAFIGIMTAMWLITLMHYDDVFSSFGTTTLWLLVINTIETFITNSKIGETTTTSTPQEQVPQMTQPQQQGYYVPQGYVQQQPQQVYYNPQQGGQPTYPQQTQSYQHPQIPQGYNPYWRQTGSQRQPVYPQSVPMQGNVQYPNNPQQPPQK